MGITATALAWQSPLPIALVLAAGSRRRSGWRREASAGGRTISIRRSATPAGSFTLHRGDRLLARSRVRPTGSSSRPARTPTLEHEHPAPALSAGWLARSDVRLQWGGRHRHRQRLQRRYEHDGRSSGREDRRRRDDEPHGRCRRRYRFPDRALSDHGSLDPSFGNGDGVFILDLGAEGVMVWPRNRMARSSRPDTSTPMSTDARFALLRLLPDGSLDPPSGAAASSSPTSRRRAPARSRHQHRDATATGRQDRRGRQFVRRRDGGAGFALAWYATNRTQIRR